MAAQPQIGSTLSGSPVQQEFQITAQYGGHHFTGVEPNFDRAFRIARELAGTGHRVTLRNADPFVQDDIVIEIYRDES